MSTRQDWFAVHNNLIDRQDLTIYEKMCCMVLARYADRAEFDNLLTLDVIANKMGCDKQSAERALFGLMTKGLLDLEDSGDGKILHPEAGQSLKTPVFESMGSSDQDEMEVLDVEAVQTPKSPKSIEAVEIDESAETAETATLDEAVEVALPAKAAVEPVEPVELVVEEEPVHKPVKKTKAKIAVNSDEFLMLLDQVYDIVQEKINEREARIILNFADHDLDVIREKYAIARKSQISDKIEVLINELQKKTPHKSAIKAAKSDEGTGSKSLEQSAESVSGNTVTSAPPVNLQPGGQINLVNINKMKLYKEMSNQASQLKGKGK